MEFTIEYSGEIGQGNSPDFIQLQKGDSELFFLEDGLLKGTPTSKFVNGNYSTPEWLDQHDVTPEDDTDLSYLELKTLPGFGIIGCYRTPTEHKLLIFEFQYDFSRYLRSGSIKYSLETPITTFSLVLENPVDKETEIVEQVAMGEHESLITPGAKVIFKFAMGEDEPIDMGTFYVDDTTFKVNTDTATANGRNLIGKALKDQTVNEAYSPGYDTVSATIESFMEYANLLGEQYTVEPSAEYRTFVFDPSKDILSCFDEIFQIMITWKIEELVDGTIVIGSPSYGRFPTRGTFQFERNTDIFSREVKMDDAEAYRQVCVHDSNWTISVYREVETYIGWNLQSNKTLFVTVPEGTSSEDAIAIADALVLRISQIGKLETFDGPFRPQLLVGDSAEISDSRGKTTLGLITEITHTFGKSGFKTSFTVDSGGSLGRGRLKDFIAQISKMQTIGSVSYAEIPPVVPPSGGYTPDNETLYIDNNNKLAIVSSIIADLNSKIDTITQIGTSVEFYANSILNQTITVPVFKKKDSTFTERGVSQTFTDADCTADSLVTVIVTSATAPQGVWSVASAAGSFTITSTVAEVADITFDYYLHKS